ncbi:MAG: N-acetyltransferase [Terracidiphilus sp.]
MQYRLYTPEDFDELYAIEEVCFRSPFRFGRGYLHQLIHRPNAATWIAEEEGQICGFGIVEWTREGGGVMAYIQTLEVVPEQRGQGVGGELLRLIEGSARAAGAQLIWFHVNTENADAIRLYAGHGYLCEDKEENYYAKGHAALIYRKPLEAETAD